MREEIVCDNTSVGVIARDDQGRILLIERRTFPTELPLSATDFVRLMEPSSSFGWAPPSGHCDGSNYGSAAFREFEGETGLRIVGVPKPLIPQNPRKNFKCRRGGEYHDWQIFEVNWQGELKPSRDETRDVKWHTLKEIRELAEKTKNYKGRMRLLSNPAIFASVGSSTTKALEREWQANPGLELVWYEFFQELKILPGNI